MDKSIIKKTKKEHDKRVSLTKSKLESIEVLISKALFGSDISPGKLALINNVLKEYNEMKEEIKNLKINQVYRGFWSIYETMLLHCLKCRKMQKVKAQTLQGQKTEEKCFY